MASKCVGEEEVGRIFAIFSLISATSSSLVYAAFQSIYRDLANSDIQWLLSVKFQSCTRAIKTKLVVLIDFVKTLD